MADLPQLPGITVTGVSPTPYDYTAALWYQLQLNEYLARQGGTVQHDPYVPPGGYNVTQAEKKPPPAPPPADSMPAVIEYEGEPELGSPGSDVPTWAMNDQEYVEYLGGGDSAYEQVWTERHPDLDLSDYGPDPGQEMFMPPMPAPPIVAPVVTRGLLYVLPWLAPFLPQSTGPRELDEAPQLPPRLPPGAPPFFDPIMPPNWNDLVRWPDVRYPTQPFAPFPFPGSGTDDPGRFALPIGDTPGLPGAADPDQILEPVTITAPRGAPTPIADFPLADAYPIGNLAPYPLPGYDLGAPRVFQGIPRPKPIDRTRRPPVDLDVPDYGAPLIRNPVDTPRPVLPPLLADPFVDTPLQPDVQPFVPTSGPPNRADTCQCEKPKKDRKKRKDRTVCYRGTYREYARGLTKNRRERVPCDSKQEAKPRKPGKRKPPTLPDLARDVFGIPTFQGI